MFKKSRSARSTEPSIRRPVAAGIFYPSEPAELKDSIDRLLGSVEACGEKALAVIVPHAATRWAGLVTAAAYANARGAKTAVVMGPSHSGLSARFGAGTRAGWETPLGVLPVEGTLARRMIQKAPDLQRDDAGQKEEHAVEVQVPFLQRIGVASFVPLTVGPCDALTAERIGEGLVLAGKQASPAGRGVARASWRRYTAPDSVAEADAIVARAVESLDGEALLQAVAEKGLSMCGAEAVAVLLAVVKQLGARRAIRVGYEVHRDTATAVSAGSYVIVE